VRLWRNGTSTSSCAAWASVTIRTHCGQQFWFSSLDEFEKEWAEVEDRNLSGFDIHFTVVPRLRKFHGKKEHPLPHKLAVCCVWADLDVGEGKPCKRQTDALRRVRDVKPKPNIIVESGSGSHPYWLVELCEVTKERLEWLLRTICEKLDGDKGAARATRLMRVPNTYNWKGGGNGKLAEARFLSKTRYRFKDLEALWNVRAEDALERDLTQSPRYLKFFGDHLHGFHVSRDMSKQVLSAHFITTDIRLLP
jgi:hypothetical protein